MRTRSMEQLLRVVTFANDRFKKGESIDDSYRYAVRRVAQEDSAYYQTIGDLCRRRLGLANISEFKEALSEALNGNHDRLATLLKRKIDSTFHERIDSFLGTLNGHAASLSHQLAVDGDVSELSVSVRLNKTDFDLLQAIAQIEGKTPEETLSIVAGFAIKERLKRIADRL